MKRLLLIIGLLLGSIFFAMVIIEVALTVFWPMQYIVPCSDWLPEYGGIAYPNARIINAKPRNFYFIYNTNSWRYRGPPINPNSPEPKIVLLGDSNIFGYGVNDDETISARMNQLFNGNAIVINLGNGGWSLGQEVRRYIELGQLYKPFIVVLHMAGNDLKEDMEGIYWVSFPDAEGNIKFRNAPGNPAGWLRTFINRDTRLYQLLLRSQLMMRLKVVLNKYVMIYHTISERTTVQESNKIAIETPKDQVIVFDFEENERRYIELLTAFAHLLNKKNVRFIFLTDDNRFYRSDKLAQLVKKLGREGMLEHYPITKWFKPGVDYPKSPQGHHLGKEACQALAQHLYDVINRPPEKLERK